MSLVLDNSVAMRWCFGDGSAEDRRYAAKVLDVMERAAVVVPVTWGLEAANVIWRAEKREFWSETHSQQFLYTLSSAKIEVDGETFSRAFTDTLRIARKFRISAYDASYLELAQRRALPLATLDEGLRKAAKRADVKIFS